MSTAPRRHCRGPLPHTARALLQRGLPEHVPRLFSTWYHIWQANRDEAPASQWFLPRDRMHGGHAAHVTSRHIRLRRTGPPYSAALLRRADAGWKPAPRAVAVATLRLLDSSAVPALTAMGALGIIPGAGSSFPPIAAPNAAMAMTARKFLAYRNKVVLRRARTKRGRCYAGAPDSHRLRGHE